jgi:NADH-quinone oxidoreductase subunit N
MKPDWLALLPLILLSGGGFLILCIGAFWKKHPSNLLYGIALVTVFFAGDVAVFWPARTPHFLMQFEAGGFGRYFTLLIALITGISLLYSHQYAKIRKFDGDEFYGLILFAAAGMTLVAEAIHWLAFFLGLEVLSLSLYVIIAIRKEQAFSNEAAIKYFIMGAVASAFLTFGIALIYAVSGELDIARSLTAGVPAGSTSVILLGFILVLVGIGFKISMVPFHLWTPDVYQGAPAPVTAFLSTGSKVALFAALLRFAFYAGNDLWTYMVPLMWILAVLTMAAGNVSALAQYQVKRLLAYSSVAQMGYLLMTLLAIKQMGAGAIMFYLAVYALMDLGAFGTLATLSAERGDLDHLDDFRGLGYSHPWRSAVLAVSLFCLAGIPPTAGFIGKFTLFWAVLHSGYILLPVIGILTVILSIYFYFKVIVALYMRPVEEKIPVPLSSLSGGFAGGIVLLLILSLGLAPQPVFDIITHALPFLSSP